MPRLASWSPVLPLFALAVAACSGSTTPAVGDRGDAIIGGVADTGAGAHDSVVLLSAGGGICTASVIAPNLLLTAWHCVANNVVDNISCDPDGNSGNGNHVGNDLTPSKLGVYTGQSPKIFSSQPVAVGKKIFHPAGNVLCNRDIALVLLASAVPGVTPMSMRLDFGAQKGELVTAVGYGKTTASDASSGKRFRRSGIPVLSVGRDWNELLGENEFALGQSTCQGDSGGPVMADDTGAILGLTSRGGDCFSGTQHFTRLDAHKALILQALAEAGADAVVEGKPAPAPTTEIAEGQGPCTTGSECESDFCLTTTGLCSVLGCFSGSCSGTEVCVATPLPQFQDPVPVCVPYAVANECDACRLPKCKAKVEACMASAACAAALTCAKDAVTPEDYDACAAAQPAGATLFKAVRDCECSKCAPVCGGACAVDPMGAGGAGGSSGTGGSSASEGGGAGASGEGGSATAGSGAGGQAGTGTAGSSGAAAPPAASSSDSGGCSVVGSSSGGSGLFALVLALPFLARRRRST